MAQAHVPLTSNRPFRSYLGPLWDYWVHGLVLSIAFVFIGMALVSYSIMPQGPTWILVFLALVGVCLVVSPLLNASLCSWLWHFDVAKYWTRLLAQGALLTTVYLTESMIINFSPIMSLVYSFSISSPNISCISPATNNSSCYGSDLWYSTRCYLGLHREAHRPILRGGSMSYRVVCDSLKGES
jgi:hypothetical protein